MKSLPRANPFSANSRRVARLSEPQIDGLKDNQNNAIGVRVAAPNRFDDAGARPPFGGMGLHNGSSFPLRRVTSTNCGSEIRFRVVAMNEWPLTPAAVRQFNVGNVGVSDRFVHPSIQAK